MQNKICIFVLSNHRSGTSATCGCLNICGIDYGKSKHPFNEPDWNEKGYFENTAFSGKHNEILDSIGQHWANPYDITKEQDDALYSHQEYKSQIIKLIEEEFHTDIFYIKDPRILFLYPVYVNVLKETGITPYFLWVQRDVNAIVKSLWRRGHTGWEGNKDLGVKHHEKHKKRFKDFLSVCVSENIPYKFSITKYSSLVSQPLAELKKMDEVLNLGLINKKEESIQDLVNSKRTEERVKEFIDSKLKHF